MKTISEIACQACLSRQTVYATLKRNGIVLEELTHTKQGNKTLYDDEAVNIILSALRKDDVNVDVKKDKELTELTDELDRLHDLEIENARLSEALKNKDELIAVLKADKEKLETENKTSSQKVEQLLLKMADLNAEKKLLEAENNRSWWRKLFKK